MKKTLQEYRIEKGMSKRRFAKDLKIPYTTYLRYEENLSNAPFATVVQICGYLGIRIRDIAC